MIADRCALKRATEAACEFIACTPQGRLHELLPWQWKALARSVA